MRKGNGLKRIGLKRFKLGRRGRGSAGTRNEETKRVDWLNDAKIAKIAPPVCALYGHFCKD